MHVSSTGYGSHTSPCHLYLLEAITRTNDNGVSIDQRNNKSLAPYRVGSCISLSWSCAVHSILSQTGQLIKPLINLGGVPLMAAEAFWAFVIL